jgi:hypothetical protein
MPATRYNYQLSNYTTTCRTCGTSVTHGNRGPEALTTDGALVSATFRFLNARHLFHLECRSCERAYRAARRTAGPRVPRTTRGAALGQVLGLDRRFGIELECMLPVNVSRETIIAALNDAGLPARDRSSGTTFWSVKGDGSLSAGRGQHGLEIVSPPLQGEQGEQAIRTATRVLRGLGATVNRSCGTHVHHDVNDLSVDAIKATATSWFNNQNLIDGLVSDSRRNDENGYCRRLTSRDMETIRAIRTVEDMRRCYIDRYRTLNLTSYGRHGTIEVRQHQGTLDAEKIISWLRFGQAIIDTAKQGTTLAQHTTIREMFLTLGSRMNETARTFLTGRAVEFGWATV